MSPRSAADHDQRRAGTRQRLVRAVAVLAAAAFGAFAVVAMASESPHNKPSSLRQVTTPAVAAGSPSSTPGTTGSDAAADTGAAGSDNSTGAGGLDGTGAGATDTGGSGAGDQGAGTTSSRDTSGGSGDGSASAGAGNTTTAIVSGLLSTSTFATNTGVPLLCGAIASGTGPFVSNPELAQVISTITSACNQSGIQSTAALATLNQQLAALSAINPAVDPVLDQLASIFNTASNNPNLPFVSTLSYVIQLIHFLHG